MLKLPKLLKHIILESCLECASGLLYGCLTVESLNEYYSKNGMEGKAVRDNFERGIQCI
jgi:hypothetical protein